MYNMQLLEKVSQIFSDSAKWTNDHRSVIIELLNKALEIFSYHKELTFDEVMSNGLRPIAEAFEVDRIAIFRCVHIDGQKRLKQRYLWVKSENGLTGISVEVLPGNQAVAGWLEILLQDICINKQSCEMSEDEITSLDIAGVKSMVMVPVFAQGELWGGITFQDHVNERRFDDACTDLMRMASRLCADAVMRTEMMYEVAEKNELNYVMFENAPIGLTMFDGNCKFIDCNKTLLAMYGITKQHYGDHFFDLSPEYQPDGVKSFDKFCDVIKRTLDGEKMIIEWMHCSPAGDPIPCEVTTTCTKYNDKYICLAYVYDLRNMKKMEEAIAEAEKRTHAVTEASPISYVLFNDDLQVVDCNNATLQIFGCPDKEYLLNHYWDLFTPIYQPGGQKSFDKVAMLKKDTVNYGKIVFEWAHKTFEGEMFPVEDTMTCMVYNGERYFISHKYDLRNIKKMEESIRLLETEAEKIYYDALTGIYNRRYFDENMNHVMKALSRSGGELSLMMIDIDFFKNFNDTYGHNEGDECLKIIAETLSKSVTRTGDFAARYGGEEFAIVLPNADEKGACMIAEKLLENIRACNIPHKASKAAGFVTVSIGVTTGNVNHMQSMTDYIKQADEMLYKSKKAGCNTYHFQPLEK